MDAFSHGSALVLTTRKETGCSHITCIADVVKMNLIGEPTIFLRLLADTVCEAFGEETAESRFKFRRVRQSET